MKSSAEYFRALTAGYHHHPGVSGQLFLIILHTFYGTCMAIDGLDNGVNHYPSHRTLPAAAAASPVITGYSSNVNPFLSLYQNTAPYVPQQPYGAPTYPSNDGGAYNIPQQQPQQQQQQQQPYANQVQTAYVPIQQAYTVAYYPSYQPTTPAPSTGPYVPAPPGQRPYCAKDGQTYCEHVEYYPTKLVLTLLDDDDSDIDNFLVSEDKNTISHAGYYNITPTYFYDYSYTTNANGQPLYPTNYYPPHGHRKKRQIDEDDMCPTSDSFVTARAAENSNGDWKYVVNIPEVDRKFQQLVKVSKCRGTTCRGLCTPPSGSSAVCEQQYVQTRLFSLDPSGAKLNNELFKFPHCCICKISTPN